MGTINPTAYTESAVVSAQRVSAGSTARGTLDLTNKYGARLLLRLGRNNTTALGSACQVLIRPVYGGSSGTRIHPGSNMNRTSTTAGAGASTTISADASAAATSITVSSGTGIAAGDIIKIEDGSGGTFGRLEFARVAKVSGTTVTLDAPLQYAHSAANADTVVNGADVFAPIWLSGGSLYEVVFDFAASGSGGPITVEALAQTYATDTY